MVKSKERKANSREKMIEVKVQFFTNNIAKSTENIVPKHAWTNGMIVIKPNKSHNIDSGSTVAFNSLTKIPKGIERCIINHNIKLHISNRMKKYIRTD